MREREGEREKADNNSVDVHLKRFQILHSKTNKKGKKNNMRGLLIMRLRNSLSVCAEMGPRVCFVCC